MFEELEKINTRPKPFEFNTVSDLWTDEYTSKREWGQPLTRYKCERHEWPAYTVDRELQKQISKIVSELDLSNL